jgi:hypothetical protein
VVEGPRCNAAGPSDYLIGVDLGQKQDYTAIAVVARWREVGKVRDAKTMAYPVTLRYDLRHLERVALGTEWEEIVRRVGELSRAAAQAGRWCRW